MWLMFNINPGDIEPGTVKAHTYPPPAPQNKSSARLDAATDYAPKCPRLELAPQRLSIRLSLQMEQEARGYSLGLLDG